MKTKTLMFGMIFLIFIASASATLTININPSFSENEEVYFDYSILSDETQDVTYIVNVDCPSLPVPLLSFETINLQANVEFKDKYTYLRVPADAESQECRVLLSVTEPEEITNGKSFLIETKDSFDFNVKLDKKVYVKDENIVISYESSLTPEINAILTYPDGTTKDIDIPATITAEQIGTYNLEVTASKEGYKSVTRSEQFGVIEKRAEIVESEPQDKPETTTTSGQGTPASQEQSNIILIILIMVVILIAVIVYFIWKKKR